MSSKMSALTVSSNDHNNNPGFPYGLQWKCSDSAISVTGVGCVFVCEWVNERRNCKALYEFSPFTK